MVGEANLKNVIDSMLVSWDGIEYGFASLQDCSAIGTTDIFALICEREGKTLIASIAILSKLGLSYQGPFSKLTIEVHTSLELVGLTALLAKTLAEDNIAANVVAAYYHDHIFVPSAQVRTAVELLNSLKG